MTRKPLIAGNWKMYKTGTEAVTAAEKLAQLTRNITHTDIMIAPTYLSLPLVASALQGSRVAVGAQNLFYETQGAFTGEVSAPMVAAAGASYAIIGHSERRQYFGETDESVNRKVKAAVHAGLRPIVCIGETEQEKDEQQTFSVLDKQVTNGVKGFRSDELKDMVIAYEPVWAIGTGKTATPDQVNEVHRYIRSQVERRYGKELAKTIRIVYGGSVKPDNVTDLMALDDVDGALVGGASLDPETFIKIIMFNTK
ncbi:MAG: triose-phosphate isomerase [Pseudomonadota bacterium]